MNDRAKILLVDDRPDKHVVYRAILDQLGQQLVTAMSGEQALREVLKDDFAVIVLDVNMPGMDGLETAELIRGRKRSAHVPIIFVTADYGDEVRSAKGYSLGAVDFMVSPIVPEILRTKVKVFVDLFLLARQAKRQARERVALAAERSARAAAEKANRRSAFLARASVALSGSLNCGTTTRELVQLAVPFLADVAALTLSLEDDVDERTIVALAGDVAEPAPRIESTSAVACDWWREAIDRVMATGIRESFASTPRAAAGFGSDAAATPGPLEIPRGAMLESLVIFPLAARGRTIGALSLGLGPSGRTFEPDALALASDVAGRAAIALDNALLYRELRAQDRRKDEFLAVLSHELRNPLAPITNAVHVLNSHRGDKGRLEWASGVLQRQVGQLRRLVDDLLDVSRITHGKIELRLESVDIADVVSVAVETAKPFLDARGHLLAVDLPAHPMRVKGDAARLAQILANLLNNAAKFTERGGRISLAAAQDGDEAVIRVKDSGIGIPTEALASIFEAFRQLRGDSDRAQGGLGVGLTLVKRLIELHGGTIEARSEGHAKGSEFVVRLPVLSETSPESVPQTPVADHASRAPTPGRRRILVADDNVDLAASMGMLLEMMGNDVRVTYDGLSAVTAETEFRPEVVFLDIGMSKMSGFEACRRIRDQPWGKAPVIVALTGWGQPEDVRRSREAGFDHHWVKPVEPAVLERFLAGLGQQTA